MEGYRDARRAGDTRGAGEGSRQVIVSSRRRALATLRQAVLDEEPCPILITGESGAGKSWLWHSLASELPGGWRSLGVDVSRALDGLDFLRLVTGGLGVAVADSPARARLDLAAMLRDEAADGRSWLLAIEDPQDASDQVWSEIKALIGAMPGTCGFGAIVLVGPTELARQLSTRRLAAIASRLETHVHLLPLDVDEAIELLRERAALDQAVLESLHRDAAGNPRRLLKLARRTVRALPAATSPGEVSRPAQLADPSRQVEKPSRLLAPVPDPQRIVRESPSRLDVSVVTQADSERPASALDPLVPTRPPLRIEDGLIEVGWGGSLEAESAAASADPSTNCPTASAPFTSSADLFESAEPDLPTGHDSEALPSEEMIEDHYAALQAWSEWARNRGRGTEPTEAWSSQAATGESQAADQPERPGDGNVWGEPQHEHAPYSRLFTRLHHSR